MHSVNHCFSLRSLLLAVFTAITCAASAASRPNVLVIVADDLGWAGVGFHNKAMVTPHLDKLAKEGAELQRFYVCPTCSPTRVALLTGQMPRRYNVISALQGAEPGMPAGVPTIASVFKSSGYRTSLIGKWHVGQATQPQSAGFDHYYGFLSSEIDYYQHIGKGGRLDWQRNGKPLQEEGYSTYLFADEAVKQIAARDPIKPFYLQVSLNSPHVPLSAPPELVKKHPGANGLYTAVVEAMDIGIGRILAALDAAEIRDNTLVLFFSDNGASGREGGSNAPFSGGKFGLSEGGIHTPALIRWPGKIPAGAVLTQPVCVQDVFPTLAAAAEVPLPRDSKLDGSSQWPALTQAKRLERPPFLIATSDIALIDGDWKVVEWSTGTLSLFNLSKDPAETNDLYGSEASRARALTAKLDELKKDLPAVTAQRAGPPGPGKGGPGMGKGKGKGGPMRPGQRPKP